MTKFFNKKIKNSKETILDGIKFKSEFESKVYLKLKEEGLNPTYETDKFILWRGFKPLFFKDGVEQTSKQLTQDWTYTPDFTIKYKSFTIFVEAKGFPNDLWNYKRKLFLKSLVGNPYLLFFEVKTEKGLLKTINIIKQMDYVKRITGLCSILPQKDRKYADKFIKERDFESLLEIVESDIVKVKSKIPNNDIERDDFGLELLRYEELRTILISYLNLILGDETEEF